MQYWYVYIVKCHDNSLYTGVTTDVSRRINEHNSSKKGAKYTKSRRPVQLVWHIKVQSRSEALKEEYRIKQLSRKYKLKLIQNSHT